MRRTLSSVVLILGLVFAPATLATDPPEHGSGWIVTLLEMVEDVADSILFWTEAPPGVTDGQPGMPEPMG